MNCSREELFLHIDKYANAARNLIFSAYLKHGREATVHARHTGDCGAEIHVISDATTYIKVKRAVIDQMKLRIQSRSTQCDRTLLSSSQKDVVGWRNAKRQRCTETVIKKATCFNRTREGVANGYWKSWSWKSARRVRGYISATNLNEPVLLIHNHWHDICSMRHH